jgi:hypothetical protein
LGRELFKLDLSKFHDVVYYGRGYTTKNYITNVPQILQDYKERDLIFTSVFTYASMFSGYEKVRIKKVHYEVDYCEPFKTYQGTSVKQKPFYYQSKYNLIFSVSKRSTQDMKNHNIAPKIFWLPFSVSTDKYYNMNIEKEFDLMAVFLIKNSLYPNRAIIQQTIRDLPYKSFIQSVIHEEYIKKINQSKIFITSNNIYSSLNMKYTEVLSCGTLLFADKPEDLDDVGLKDGEHLIIYTDINDLKNKIQYYLHNDKEREEIAKNGMEFVRKNHSNEVRIKEMTEIIQKELF